MKIYLSEWNKKNDTSRKWGSKEKGGAKLDDTSKCFDIIHKHLKSLGYEVHPVIDKPPQSTKDFEPDLFIGIGAGDPLGIPGFKKHADGDLLGAKTNFPIVWIGAQNASSNPFAVRYRTLARWKNSDIEDISPVQRIDKFVPFEKRNKRNKNIRLAVDNLLLWYSRCKNNPSTALKLKGNEQTTEPQEIIVNFNYPKQPIVKPKSKFSKLWLLLPVAIGVFVFTPIKDNLWPKNDGNFTVEGDIVLGDKTVNYQDNSEENNYNTSNILKIEKGTKDLFDILVLPLFLYNNDSSTGLGVKVYERLKELKYKDSLNLNVQFYDIEKDKTFDKEKAKQILDSLDYDLIIYGDVLETNCSTNKICLNHLSKIHSISTPSIYSSTSRELNEYKVANVEDVIEGKIQGGFEDLIYFYSSIVEQSEYNYDRALKFINNINNKEIQDPIIEDHKSDLLWALHKYEESSKSTEVAGQYFLNEKDTISAIEKQLQAGAIIVQVNKYYEALRIFEKAYELSKQIKNIDNEIKFQVISNLATTQNQIGDTIQMIKYYEEALDSLSKWKDPKLTFNRANIYLNLALIQIEQTKAGEKDKIDSIGELINKGEGICLSMIPNDLILDKSECLYLLGRTYIRIKKFDLAEFYLTQASELYSGDFSEKRIFNLHIMYQNAIAKAQLKKYSEAKELIRQGIKNSKETFGFNVIEDRFNDLKNEIIEIEKATNNR